MAVDLDPIRGILDQIVQNLKGTFGENLKSLILYGSWATGRAKDDSDIDLMAVFEKVDRDTRELINKSVKNVRSEKLFAVEPAPFEDFQKETVPFYTAAKREGIVIFGDADLAISTESPSAKYAEFFKRSAEFEGHKVKIAEDIFKERPSYDVADLCYIASKHAIQAALAMKGVGYSSKVAVLLPLAEEYLGKETADAFRRVFELYVKSEYKMESLEHEEKKLALEYAKRVMEVYSTLQTPNLQPISRAKDK